MNNTNKISIITITIIVITQLLNYLARRFKKKLILLNLWFLSKLALDLQSKIFKLDRLKKKLM